MKKIILPLVALLFTQLSVARAEAPIAMKSSDGTVRVTESTIKSAVFLSQPINYLYLASSLKNLFRADFIELSGLQEVGKPNNLKIPNGKLYDLQFIIKSTGTYFTINCVQALAQDDGSLTFKYPVESEAGRFTFGQCRIDGSEATTDSVITPNLVISINK